MKGPGIEAGPKLRAASVLFLLLVSLIVFLFSPGNTMLTTVQDLYHIPQPHV